MSFHYSLMQVTNFIIVSDSGKNSDFFQDHQQRKERELLLTVIKLRAVKEKNDKDNLEKS